MSLGRQTYDNIAVDVTATGWKSEGGICVV